jgi:hypothetical protein
MISIIETNFIEFTSKINKQHKSIMNKIQSFSSTKPNKNALKITKKSNSSLF